MYDEDERLRSIGIHVITDAGNPLARAECVRIARRIHLSGHRIVGFVPATDDVAVPSLIIQLGMALTELTGATIAVVDGNVRWPGLPGLAEPEDGQDPADPADLDGSVFRTRWLRGSLALLTPPRAQRAGEAVPQIARLLLEGTELFAHVLVDLTGFDLLGEHASAAACMDVAVLVGRARKTRERHLLLMEKAMPANRFLGVLLVG